MQLPTRTRVSIAFAICIGLCLFNLSYDDIFHGDFKGYAEVDVVTPLGERSTGIAHFSREPPVFEVILRVAIPVLSFLGIGAYVARVVTTRKVWSGAIASMFVGLLTFTLLWSNVAAALDEIYVPNALSMVAWISVSLSLGAASAWLAAVWWPNKSLERTREG